MALSTFFGFRKSDEPDVFSLVVDGVCLAPSRVGGEELVPRAKLEILQQLSRIAKTEGWGISVVFVGEELRKAAGGEFLGVATHYSREAAGRADLVLAQVKAQAKRGAVLVVTDDVNLEERAQDTGAQVLRGSTFRKAFEELFVPRRRPQSRLMRRHSQMMEQRAEQDDEEEDGDLPRRGRSSRNDDVSDLIDLVD